MMNVRDRLFTLRDEAYGDFTAKLVPNVPRENIIGVRAPALRKLAKELSGSAEAAAFLQTLPHTYLEENHLHGFLIERVRDYGQCVAALDAFLPFIDNWATCDSIGPACLGRDHARLIGDVQRWLDSERLYTKRFAIRMLMNHFLDADFHPEYLARVAEIRAEEYYLSMMQAWYFATALAKQYEAALPYIEQGRLEPRTHNRAIQKAVESRRVSEAQKAYLKTLRRKAPTGRTSPEAGMTETERLRLYPAAREEMEAVIAAEEDEGLRAAYSQMLEGCLQHPDQWAWYAMWRIERKDGTPVGDLCFKGLAPDDTAEIGYGILDTYQGRGYATEAVSAAVAWAFRNPALRAVTAETTPGNTASQRVLEKCGFTATGEIGEEGPRFAKSRPALIESDSPAYIIET